MPRDQEDAEAIQSLTRHGWRVVNAMPLSHDNARYRDYILASRGDHGGQGPERPSAERLVERSERLLSRRRSPVVTQDTAFGKFVPTGEGLFAFTSLDDILAALEAINSDYGRHARAAREIAEAYFKAETVLARLVEEAGVGTPPRQIQV